MYSGPSGFQNAPVTKALVIVSAALSIVLSSRLPDHPCTLSYESLFIRGEWLRLPLSSLSFSSTPDLIVGCLLVYFFRLIERQMGAGKYVVLLLFSSLVSTVLQVALLFALPALNPDDDTTFMSPLASGPFGFIYALFVLYYADVPPTARFVLASRVHLSDKALVYLGGLQLLLSSSLSSIIPGLTGVIAGALYRSNTLGIRKAKLPDPVSQLASSWLLPLLSWPSSNRIAATTQQQQQQQQRRRQQQLQGFQAQPPAPLAAPDPSETDIESLVAMGFDRDAVVSALRQARNDIHIATNLLLEG